MTAQPRVPVEATSWCIDSLSLRHWDQSGVILQKAHRVRETTQYRHPVHMPLCGAQVAHSVATCVEAPPGWPACRHCARKLSPVTIPAVYFD